MLPAFVFGITGPIGIAVALTIKGIVHTNSTVVGPHSILSMAVDSNIPRSSTCRLRGVMFAISARLFIYASRVEPPAGEFVNHADLRKRSRGRHDGTDSVYEPLRNSYECHILATYFAAHGLF